MRALLFCLAGLITATPEFGFAQQMKLSPKAAPGANETRYFTAIDGLMDGNADVVLKETRQGKAVTAAVLDVCYPIEKGSDRKDRFVANLADHNGHASQTSSLRRSPPSLACQQLKSRADRTNHERLHDARGLD